MPESDVTVSASFVPAEYTIHYDVSENGTVTGTASAHYGDTVSLNVKADDGAKLSSLTVSDAQGAPVEVNDNAFTMPAGDVTVSATFIKGNFVEESAPYIDENGAYITGNVAHFAGADGKNYAVNADGSLTTITNEGGLKGAWHAFMPGGAESTETTYQNVSGNQLGSWLMRINYNQDTWRLRLYADKYFEDHSGMLLVDYDGYTTGEGWATGVKRKYFLYDLKDWQLGMELNLKYGSWLRDIVVEYMYTKYQSGPIYHDHTKTIADHIGGNDNFYNHYISNGWQHWGQVIGNPLFQSPIYNEDGSIEVKDNRFMAFHAGISGRPTENLQYRLLATYQEGLGTYSNPYTKKHHNVSFMLEADYTLPHNWNIKGAYGMDFGHILGHNAGGQITISKTGLLTKKGKKK